MNVRTYDDWMDLQGSTRVCKFVTFILVELTIIGLAIVIHISDMQQTQYPPILCSNCDDGRIGPRSFPLMVDMDVVL